MAACAEAILCITKHNICKKTCMHLQIFFLPWFEEIQSFSLTRPFDRLLYVCDGDPNDKAPSRVLYQILNKLLPRAMCIVLCLEAYICTHVKVQIMVRPNVSSDCFHSSAWKGVLIIKELRWQKFQNSLLNNWSPPLSSIYLFPPIKSNKINNPTIL